MKRLLLCTLVVGLLVSMVACGGGVPAKAKTPAEVVDKVKVGMSNPEVLDIIDEEYFTQNLAFMVVNFSELEVVGDAIRYVATKDIESPYYGWLLFGVIVQDLNPALVGFTSDGTVIIVDRIPFAEAQRLVEWQSGRPFRR